MHNCEETATVFLFLQSTRVDWLVAEISRQRRDFAQILQLVMWIRTILFAVGVHRLMFPTTRAISRTDTFQGQEVNRILLYKIPAQGIPEEGSTGGEILASRLPVYGTKDAGRGLWLRVKNTCKQFGCSLNQILPTLFTLRDDDSKIIAGCLLMWTICCMAIYLKELKS